MVEPFLSGGCHPTIVLKNSDSSLTDPSTFQFLQAVASGFHLSRMAFTEIIH